MTLIRFREHTFRSTCKYVCTCGKRFQRSAKTYWTENPFNKRWVAGDVQGLNREAEEELKRELAHQACPNCGGMCKPRTGVL